MSDLISRQAAIDALHMHLMYRMGTDSNKKRLDDWINNLPSARPKKRTQERTETYACDLIDREAAVDAIYHHLPSVSRMEVRLMLHEVPSAQSEPFMVTIDHELTKDEVERLKQSMSNTPIVLFPSVQPEPQWIPCSERLPDEGRYLVTRHDYVTKTNFIDILWFEKNVWWNRQFTGNFAVIAWMPLPESYRAERRTDEKKDI